MSVAVEEQVGAAGEYDDAPAGRTAGEEKGAGPRGGAAGPPGAPGVEGIVRFVLPSLATVLSAPLLSLTDTAFVGRCAASAEASSTSLAALSQATVLADYLPLLATFTATAALNLVARHLARGDEEAAVGAASCAVGTAAALGAGIALVICCLPAQILAAQGVRGGVLGEAVTYCRWRALGVPLSSVTAAACASLAARKDTVVPLVGVLAAGAVNVLLDWLLVPSLGVGGAAAATSFSQVVCACVVVGAVLRRGHLRAPRAAAAARWAGHARDVGGFAVPVIFVTTSVLSIFTALIVVSSRMGVTTSAAHQILGALFALTSLCGDPLMQAVQAFLPAHLIAGDLRGAGRFLLTIVGTAVAFSVVAGSASLGIAYLGGSLFTSSGATIAEIRSALPYFSAAVVQVIPCKALYGAALAANQLGFLTTLVAGGTLLFMLQLWMLLRSGLGYGYAPAPRGGAGRAEPPLHVP